MSQQNNNQPSVEAELARLDEMVAWFEGETFTLDEAVAHYQEAETLAAQIETRLATLKNEVVVLKKKFDQAE
jgi:exodeoxyribonuclease VII small subunit